MISLLSAAALAASMVALVSAMLVRDNLRVFCPPPEPAASDERPAVSVLIPARDEETAIEASVTAALASRGVEVEVVVLDDRSEDGTARIVRELSRRDGRARLVPGEELPPGWCGKQHACWILAHESRYPLLVYIDADVRLAPDALCRLAAGLESSGADLLSGFPRQETVGWLEKLVIPLMHFILLGFLPMRRMRRSRDPAFAAGCGQLFITRREAYDRSGGHAAIRGTLHDGLKLPRAYRLAGLKTDLCDATDLAVCRMYRSAGEVWNGLAKNAGEALAAPRLIVPMTVLLLAGQVLPVLLLAAGLADFPGVLGRIGWAGVILALSASYYSRWAPAIRFRQSKLGALLHPLGVVVFVAIQWYAFVRHVAGRPSAWKGRLYGGEPAFEPSRSESTTR
jgi:glycosyltransferase involved in cell wall biosynthesis